MSYMQQWLVSPAAWLSFFKYIYTIIYSIPQGNTMKEWKNRNTSGYLTLTLQQNDCCVSNDADCSEENQNGEDVGTDGVC